jgi:hypothetical protein
MSDVANIITQAPRVAAVPGGIYGGIDYHGEPPWDKAFAAGWRKLDERVDVTPPDGYYISHWVYSQDSARVDYAIEEPWVVQKPIPVPERFAAGIDTSLLVMDAPDGSKGIGYVPAADGTLLPLLYAHESPYDMPSVEVLKDQARADYETRKSAREAVRLDVAAKAGQAEAGAKGAGNSVAVLRAEVARLAAAVKALTEGGL